MAKAIITAGEFRERLARLCTTARSSDLPRKARDRAIILKSIALTLSPGKVYSELELKSALIAWTGAVGNTVDHAALRRYLIDEKFVSRSADGRSYELIINAHEELFDEDVNAIDPAIVVNNAILDAAAKREAFRAMQS